MSIRSTIALLLGGVALSVAGCSSGAGAGWTFAPAAGAAATQLPASSQPAAGGAGGTSTMPMGGGTMAGMMGGPVSGTPASGATVPSGGTIEIHAVDLGFRPAAITVASAGTYSVRFVNDGATLHNVTFADGTAVAADAGKTATGSVTVPAAGLAFSCSIPGHAEAGMRGTVTVAGSGAGTAAGADPAAPAAPGTSTVAGQLPAADPNAPPYVLYPAAAPAVLPGTVHDVNLPIVEKDMTVATGYRVHVWTFGGTVPGPVIRVHLGDTVRVHLTNQTQMSHSIDFHASQTAMNDQMVEIKPGSSWTYTFKADYAGVWMYHCGTAPALEHIANGMFGMVIVEPRGGLPKVDREFALVQSEWYLGGQDQPADYAKANAAAPSPDFVVFNGVANQYKDHPLQVEAGEKVRFFVLDAGPNVDSSFHIVGTIFHSVIKEGVALQAGNAGGWGSQAVDLAPAQAAIVELTVPEDGMYTMVTHAFNFVGRGAVGALMAGDGTPPSR